MLQKMQNIIYYMKLHLGMLYHTQCIKIDKPLVDNVFSNVM